MRTLISWVLLLYLLLLLSVESCLILFLLFLLSCGPNLFLHLGFVLILRRDVFDLITIRCVMGVCIVRISCVIGICREVMMESGGFSYESIQQTPRYQSHLEYVHGRFLSRIVASDTFVSFKRVTTQVVTTF